MTDSPLKMILRAVKARDWAKVSEGIAKMTKARASPKRAKVKKPAPEDDDPLQQFRMEQGQVVKPDGKKSCRVLPYEAPTASTWVDDRTLARNKISDTKKMAKKIKPSPPRQAVKKVRVVCERCGKKSKISVLDAPASIGGEAMAYYCNKCAGRRRGRD